MRYPFEPDLFYYIKLREYGDAGERKMPLEQWGGYDTNFDENPCVYTFDETLKEDHWNWAIIDCTFDTYKLGVLDVDTYKIDDFVPSKFRRPKDHGPVIRTVSGGYHFPFLIARRFDVKSAQPYVDVKGAAAKGHIVSPFHNDDYELVRHKKLFVYDHVEEINEAYSYDGDVLVTDPDEWGSSYGGGFEILEEPPEEMPYCLKKALEARRQIPRDGTFVGNPWQIDSIVGRRLVAFGYTKKEAMTMLSMYEPRDGYDERESSYQMDMLYRKVLHPDARSKLRTAGVFDNDDWCECPICERIAGDIERPARFSSNWTGLEGHQIMASIARTGKTHTFIKAALEPMHDGKRKAYLGPTHNEVRATYDKITSMGGTSVVHFVGEQRAREDYDISYEGQLDMSTWVSTPEEAARLPDHINGYQVLKRCAREADFVCTVPELFHEIGHVDLLIITEEAVIKRMEASAIKLVEAKEVERGDRRLYKSILAYEDQCRAVVNDIDELQQVDYVHRMIRNAALVMLDICDYIDNWSPGDWKEVTDSGWFAIKDSIERALEDIYVDDRANFSDVVKRVRNYPRVDEILLNAMYHSGLEQYPNTSRKQLFLIGDVNRLFANIDKSTTIWTAGNSIERMRRFHKLAHGNPPEPIGFKGGYTPVQDCSVVIKYTGGDNPNHQSGDVGEVVRELSYHAYEIAALVVAGSSRHTAWLAAKNRRMVTMSEDDTLADFEHYAKSGISVASPENSRFTEGVDSPFFHMTALYNGRFATPVEDYITDKTGDNTLRQSELARGAQNAVLRASNVPDGDKVIGTGTTPCIVPSRHVPNGFFDMLEAFGIEVVEAETPLELRLILLDVLEPPTVVVYDDHIVPQSEAPTPLKAFEELRSSSS